MKANAQILFNIVSKNLIEDGYYSPRDRFLDINELRSVMKSLAKFHADGIKFLKDGNQKEYPFLKVRRRVSLPINTQKANL